MPFRNVAVGVWSYDTHTNTNVAWGTRLPLLTQAVARLATFRDQQAAAALQGADQKQRQLWEGAGSRFSMVFVAPEYMFMGTCAAGLSNLADDRFLDEATEVQILTALTAISTRYGTQLVFVPGSTAYKKPFLKANDCAEDIAARYAKVEGRLEGGAAQIQAFHAKHGIAITRDEARGTELSGAMGGRVARSTDDKLATLRKGATNRFEDTYLGQNKMFMLHRGKVIATYRKRCDFHEVLPGYTQRTIFIPGYKKGRATVAGVPLGLEICLDHGTGVLSGSASATGDLPAVHVLASACVKINPGNVVVRDGGYVLHASSELTYTGAWRVTRGAVTYAITEDANVGNGMLRMGVMELNVA